MSEFVGHQFQANLRLGGLLTTSKYDVVANRAGGGVDGCCRTLRVTSRVYSHMAEVVSEAHLEVSPGCRSERIAGGSQYVVNDRRYGVLDSPRRLNPWLRSGMYRDTAEIVSERCSCRVPPIAGQTIFGRRLRQRPT